MNPLIEPLRIPLRAKQWGRIIFLSQSGHKRRIVKRVSAVFLMLRCDAIRFLHAAKLP